MSLFKNYNHIWLLFLLLIGVVFYLRYIEQRTIFYPDKAIQFSPKDAGIDYQELYLTAPGNIKLYAWFVPCKSARYTILFCHGNAGNISHRLEKIGFFNKLGCNVLIFDYRGYGRSQGRPTEKGLYNDVQTAYDYLLAQNIGPQQIIGYGESIGCSVIINLAYKNKMRALIIDSAFSSAKDMARYIYPFIPYWVFSSRFDSLTKIKSITIPKFIIHSVNDEIVPYKLGQKLFNAAADPKEFLGIHGGHNSCFYESEEVLKEKIAGFINSLSS